MNTQKENAKSQENSLLYGILKAIALLAVLYLFFYSLELMGISFKHLGKEVAQKLLSTTSNPFSGLLIGILVTSIIQSSSTTTSMTVGMVGTGLLPLHNAIPIIMGSNIGTSITNTIVSLGSINNNVEFRRAFSASIVHDFFNIITVAWMFPLQYYTGFLEKSANFLGEQFVGIGGTKLLSPVKALTKPLAHWTLELVGNNGVIGGILGILFLIISLRYLVKLLQLIVVGKVEALFRRKLFKTAGRALVLGLLLTILVQSSSITTSFIVPIVGAGILTLEQIFPYTLGANIGTTVTAILAALVIGKEEAITASFAHLLFNIFGILVIWKFQFIPIKLARKFADLATEKKYLAFLYILIVFFIIPLSFIIITE